MATFEYLFCIDFWKGDSQIFRDVFAQPLQAMDEYVQSCINTNFDAIGLALAILINRGHQKLMQRRRKIKFMVPKSIKFDELQQLLAILP